jgi:Tat protein translocase TatB subunit
MDFFGIGFGELVLVMLIALIVFGPAKLPEMARTLGKFSRNLKKMSSDFTATVTKEIGLEEERESLKKASSDVKTAMTTQIDIEEAARSHLSPGRPPKETAPAPASVREGNPAAFPSVATPGGSDSATVPLEKA